MFIVACTGAAFLQQVVSALMWLFLMPAEIEPSAVEMPVLLSAETRISSTLMGILPAKLPRSRRKGQLQVDIGRCQGPIGP